MASRLLGFCLLFAFFTASPMLAQVRALTGRVTNQETGAPVLEAVISVDRSGISARTGSDGRFSMNVPEGDQTLTILAIGYKRQNVTAPAASRAVSA